MSVIPTQLTHHYNNDRDVKYSVSSNTHVNSAANEQPEITFKDMMMTLVKHKLLVFLVIFTLIMTAFFYTKLQIPSYRANAIVQIEREGVQIVDFGQTRKATNVFEGDQDPFFRTRYEMLKGRVLSQRVIDELNLYESLKLEKFRKIPLADTLKKLFGVTSEKSEPINLPVDYNRLFSERLKVIPIDGTHLVKVFYEAASPIEAKNVVTALLNNFIKLQIETKSDTGTYAKQFLSKQLQEAGERLRIAETRLVQFANEKGILKMDNQQTRHIKNLENLDAALVAAEIKRIEKESLYHQMKKEGSVSTVLTNPVIIDLKARLFKMEGDYQELLKTYNPNHQKLIRLKQQIITVTSTIKKELANIEKSMKADYLAAKNQEERIRGELSQFKKEMVNLQDNSMEYNQLKREVVSNEKLYNNLQQRLEEVNVASAANTSSISIIEPAVIPFEKYRPSLKLNLLIGLFTGLIIALLAVYLREVFSAQKIQSFEDLERIFHLPVLGRIPKITNKAVKDHLNMIVKKKPFNPAAEAFQILSANIQLILGRYNERAIYITSVKASQGKSVTATNMACAYAAMGKRVLLIDADLRKPSLHDKIGINNETGLSNYLKGETNIVGITQPVKSVPGLFLITAGAIENDPVSLLSHERMQYLVTQGSKIFDYVIIDGPPVMGFADSLLLSAIASSTLIVAKENDLELQDVKMTIKKLERIKKSIIGFLLVNVKTAEAQEQYYLNYRQTDDQGLLIEDH